MIEPEILFGILNLNKPLGATSRQAVDCVKRLVRPAKVGHAGTLDPLATGVLLVCVGPATKLIEYAHQFPKTYRGTFLLGRSSPTDDLEGDVELLPNAPEPTLAEIEAALPQFVGEIQQRPPAYSAIKVNGKRSYDEARKGNLLDLPARPVTIHRLNMVSYDYPELVLDIECGTGTYVRSLGRDLASALGTVAVMSALVRTSIGPFQIEEAISSDNLTADTLAEKLLLPQTLLSHLPQVTLSDAEVIEIQNGRPIPGRDGMDGETEIVGVDQQGKLVALLITKTDGKLWPRRNFRS